MALSTEIGSGLTIEHRGAVFIFGPWRIRDGGQSEDRQRKTATHDEDGQNAQSEDDRWQETMSMMPPPGSEAQAAAPSQAPANPAQIMLAQMYQVLRRLAQENPVMSAGLQKAAQGIQEAQTSMLTQGPGPSPEQNPPV